MSVCMYFFIVLVSICRIWTLLYCSNNQANQENERESLEKGDILSGRIREGEIEEGGRKRIILWFSLSYETIRSTEPYTVACRSCYTFADFSPNWYFSLIFSTYHAFTSPAWAAKLRRAGPGGWGGGAAPLLRVNEPKWTGQRRAWDRSTAKTH